MAYTESVFYFLEGTVEKKATDYAVISCGGVGFKVHASVPTLRALPARGEPAKLFTHLHSKDDGMDLYGFADEPSLSLFELLISVSGVGPRTGLAVLSVDSTERVIAAILERRADLLLRASGIGKKTAERIILELHSRLELSHSGALVGHMSREAEVEEALVTLGYGKDDARAAAAEGRKAGEAFEEQLKAALRFLGSRNTR